VHLDLLDQLAAGGAATAAGAVNALAGGGTLISFPALVGIGVPAVNANVTNTVSLVPGYLSGSWAQRDDLAPQFKAGKVLAVAAAAGGLAGSIVLVLLPGSSFRLAVPYLILLACVLLAAGDPLKKLLSQPHHQHPAPQIAAVFLGAIYGGFFGAGLSIMFLAVLGLFSDQPLTKLNAMKQALSFVTNLIAAVFFAFSGKTVWVLVPVMAAGSLLGGAAGGRLVNVVNAQALRLVVIAAGVGIAAYFIAT
jgi:uncharacterized membrane protein YfcA